MTSLRRIEANRANAQKSTGPSTLEGKLRSRRNAVRHGLTAETVVGELEDAEDYRTFEQAIIADYDATSAVERELVLRLASLLWRLRRASTMETGLFDIQAHLLTTLRQMRPLSPPANELPSRLLDDRFCSRPQEPVSLAGQANGTSNTTCHHSEAPVGPGVELARCFLRLANLPNFALDRLSRYEAALWRQAAKLLFALRALDRRKPQERGRHLSPNEWSTTIPDHDAEY